MSEILKTYEQLENNLSKDNEFVKETLSELSGELKEKYQIDKDTILNITSEELKSYQIIVKTASNHFSSKENQKEAFKVGFRNEIYKELLETKLSQSDGIKEISIDKVTQNISNKKILESKQVLNEYVDTFTDQYDFLGPNEKEVFKLAISNKIIDSFSPLEMLNISKIVESIGEGVKKLDFAKVNEEAKKVNIEITSITNKLENTLNPYQTLFNKVNKDLNEGMYRNKVNIISNIDWFHNPEEIEKYKGEELKFNYKNVENLDIKTSISDEKSADLVAEYLIKSKIKIEKLDEQMKAGEGYKKMALGLITNEMFGEEVETALKWILEIPFLGKFLAIFLGLDPEKPFESLKNDKETYKTYKKIQNFGGTIDDKGIITKNTDSKVKILADKDLSELDYEELKPDLKYINTLQKSSKDIEVEGDDGKKKKVKPDVLEAILGKDGYNGLKITLDQDCFTNNKPNNKFYKTFSESISRYKNEKLKEQRENKEKETDQKIKELQNNKISFNKKLEVSTFDTVMDNIDIIDAYESKTETKEYKQIKEEAERNQKELDKLLAKKELYSAIQKIDGDLSKGVTVKEGKTELTVKQDGENITINEKINGKEKVEKYKITAIHKTIGKVKVKNTIINGNNVSLITKFRDATFTKEDISEAIYSVIQTGKYNKNEDGNTLNITKIS